MCLARVQFVGEEKNQAQDSTPEVARIEIAGKGLKLTDLWGEVTEFDGEVRSVDFVHSIINIKKRKAAAPKK